MEHTRVRVLVLAVTVVLAHGLLGQTPALATHGGVGPAPTAPTDLRAASLDRTVSLDWDAPAGATTAVTYAVSRALPGDGLGRGAEVLVAHTADTRYRDQGLLNGQTYTYSVRAVAATGADSEAARVQVTPRAPVPGQAQQAPVLRGAFLGARGMQLDWTPSSSPVDAFVLHRRDAGRGQQFGTEGAGTIVHAGSDLSFLDDYPFDTTEDYGFAVQTQVNGVFGPLSNEVRLTRPRGYPPTDPIRLHAQGTLEQSVLLSWNTVEHGKEYVVYKEDAPGSGTFSRATTLFTRTLEAAGEMTYEDTSVTAGKAYRYYVLCYGNQVGGHVQSNDATAVALPPQGLATPRPPSVPRVVDEVTPLAQQMFLYAVPGEDEVEVRWNPVPGAVSYEIQGGPVFGPDGLPSDERYTILADDVVTTSFRHRRTDDAPWEYFAFWLDPSGYAGAPTKYQAENLAYGRRAAPARSAQDAEERLASGVAPAGAAAHRLVDSGRAAGASAAW